MNFERTALLRARTGWERGAVVLPVQGESRFAVSGGMASADAAARSHSALVVFVFVQKYNQSTWRARALLYALEEKLSLRLTCSSTAASASKRYAGSQHRICRVNDG